MTATTSTTPIPVFCFISRKGGVGKSTCVTQLARIYAAGGLRVVVVDCDPQGTTTQALLGNSETVEGQGKLAAATMEHGDPLSSLAMQTSRELLEVVPASEALTIHARNIESDNFGVMKVRDSIQSLAHDDYDIVLLDTPGDFGAMTFGALCASSWAIVLAECEEAGIREVPKVLKAIGEAQHANADLRLLGIIANKLDRRTRHHLSCLESLRLAFPDELFDPPVPRAVELTAAMSPAAELDPHNQGVQALESIANAILERHFHLATESSNAEPMRSAG